MIRNLIIFVEVLWMIVIFHFKIHVFLLMMPRPKQTLMTVRLFVKTFPW